MASFQKPATVVDLGLIRSTVFPVLLDPTGRQHGSFGVGVIIQPLRLPPQLGNAGQVARLHSVYGHFRVVPSTFDAVEVQDVLVAHEPCGSSSQMKHSEVSPPHVRGVLGDFKYRKKQMCMWRELIFFTLNAFFK